MLTYTTLFGAFVVVSIALSNALILLARYVRQVQMPPSDEDYEKLLAEKAGLETQLAQDQRSLSNLKSSLEQVEKELANKTAEIISLKASPSAGAPSLPQ
jgi:phage shock protein A